MQTETALDLIESDLELLAILDGPQQCLVMPFANAHEKKYLCMVLSVRSDMTDLEVIARFCSRCVTVLEESGSLASFDGVELFLATVGRRLLRLSVFASSLAMVRGLTAKDLLATEPFDGATCIWYQSWPTTAQPDMPANA